MLAFPLHMAVMADGGFPFGAVGLVHVENRDRPAPADRDRRGADACGSARRSCSRTRKGRTFALLTEARVGDEMVWESTSTMLRRGGGDGDAAGAQAGEAAAEPSADGLHRRRAEWRLGGDLGRRYAAVSGDRNPIHMHALTAKPLGFPAAIAHGMWTKARCLAALEPPPARRLHRRRPLPPADRAAGAGRVRQRPAGRGDRLRRARRQAAHPAPRRPRRPLEAKSQDREEGK